MFYRNSRNLGSNGCASDPVRGATHDQESRPRRDQTNPGGGDTEGLLPPSGSNSTTNFHQTTHFVKPQYNNYINVAVLNDTGAVIVHDGCRTATTPDLITTQSFYTAYNFKDVSDEMPELQESDDESTTEPNTSTDDDDDWFDDVVPHDEQPPPPLQINAATVGQGCSPSIGLPVTSSAGAATSGQECFHSKGLPLTPEAGSICHLCNKPRWCNTYNARYHNCRDYCLHANHCAPHH